VKFVIEGRGDSSVGIPSSFGEVTMDIESMNWNEEEIERTKALLKEWDDNDTTVYTEKEYDDMIKQEEEMMTHD